MPDAPDNEWTTGEIVRSLARLADTMERVERKVDGLGNEFVPRELYRTEHAHLTGRVDEIAREITDLRADYTRREKAREADAGAKRRWGVGLAVTAALAVLGLAVQMATALA